MAEQGVVVGVILSEYVKKFLLKLLLGVGQ